MRKLFGRCGSALTLEFSPEYWAYMNLSNTGGDFIFWQICAVSDWYAMLDMGGEL